VKDFKRSLLKLPLEFKPTVPESIEECNVPVQFKFPEILEQNFGVREMGVIQPSESKI